MRPAAFVPIPLLLLLAAPLASQTTTPRDPRRVLVVYNADWPDGNGDGIGDSKEVADHYARMRGVPASNLLGLKLGKVDRASFRGSAATQWASFHDNLVTPLKAKLKVLGATKIDTILLCYGVPHRIAAPIRSLALRAVDSLLCVPAQIGTRSGWNFSGYWRRNTYFEHSPTVAPDLGRFDHAKHRYGLDDYYLVTRIDGIHVEAAKDLVDAAVYVERHGAKGGGKVEGIAYVDSRHGFKTDTWLKGNYPNYPGYYTYQLWSYRMAFGKFLPPKVGLPVKWEYSNYEIGEKNSTGKVLAYWSDKTPAASAPDAFLYGGWYNFRQYLDVWTWLPGSIACDLNSNSIRDFHNPKRSSPAFLSEALELGLAAGCGVIAEPYLQGHVRPEVLIHYIVEGFTFAEAGALADPALFWRGVRIGDPVYAPFDRSLRRTPDRSPPPAPLLAVRARNGTTADLSVLVPRRPSDPDLCIATLAYGKRPIMGASVSSRAAYHGRQDFTLKNLDAAWPAYFLRATVRDPAGNRTAGAPGVVFHHPFTGAGTAVAADPGSIVSGNDLVVRYAVAAVPDLSALTAFHLDLKAPGSSTWVEATSLLLPFLADIGLERGGRGFSGLAFALKVPKFSGPKGTWGFRIRAAKGTASSSASTTVTVR